jgi:superkiller protein 3
MRKLLFVLCTMSILVPVAAELEAASDEAVQRNNLGASLLQQGKVDEAVAEFQKAVALDPKYVAAQLNLGYAYDRKGQIEEAMAQYQKVIALEPGNLFAHNNLGVLYDKKGLYTEAVKEFEQVLQVDPSNATARDNLERAKSSTGIAQEREERFAQARKEVEARPNDPRAAYNLGRLHASFGEKEQALKWLAKALELGFDDVKFLKDDPALAPLKDDPRFTGLLKGR